MKSDEAHSKIRSALRAELKRRHGQIGQIESELNRSEGYLSRFCRGDMEISIKGLLDALDILEIEPDTFFEATLGGVHDSVVLLERFEGAGPFHKDLGSIEEALARVAEGKVAPVEAKRLHQVCLEEFLDQPVAVQARRLKTSKKYRQPEFVRDLLRHLDIARYGEPAEAAKLISLVAETVVPDLSISRRERSSLLCMALAIYSSSARLQGEFRTAIRATRLGLELARSVEEEAAQVELLERGSYAVGAIGHHKSALILLREALEIATDLENETLLGKVQVARGSMNSQLGRLAKSRRSFRQALKLLPEGDESSRRWRFACYQNLAVLSCNEENLADARKWLATAIDAFSEVGGINYAKLLWQKGAIDLQDKDYAAAEQCLVAAYEILEDLESPEFPLVSVDLVKVLILRGKREQAVEIAKKMAALVGSFDHSRILDAAVVEFLRVVLQGRLTEAVLDEFRERMETLARNAGRAQGRVPQ